MRFLPLLLALWSSPAFASDLSFNYVPNPAEGQKPAFMVTPSRGLRSLQVVITAGDKTHKFERTNVPAGKELRFEWARDERVTEAQVHILAEYDDYTEEEQTIGIRWAYAGKLTVDLSRASADVNARTITVRVSAPVDRADVIAYGAHKAIVEQQTVDIGAGPGDIAVPWLGSPSETVLLDVTLHSGNAWAGFTYSPWFLDIPHEDVLFESDQATIRPSEEPKLQATLEELRDVLDKYGAIVPVKLYIAGCTDTVGDAAHNQQLSRARAKAIAQWLRSHGYDKPIYYHGFGESLLAVPTPDNTDNAANRRALYIVAANPPPASAGFPAIAWTPL